MWSEYPNINSIRLQADCQEKAHHILSFPAGHDAAAHAGKMRADGFEVNALILNKT